MEKIICGKCHAENNAKRHFCAKCGAFLHTDFDAKVYALPEVKMMRVVENLLRVPHQPINWDDVTDAYTAKAEKWQALFNVPGMGAETNSAVVEKIEDFLNLCRNADFQIAFVGTIKTGKSTLINALLGKEYASMDVTPETAALTKFRASPRDYVDVTFYTQKEWDNLWASRSKDATDFMKEYELLDGDSQKSKWINQPQRHIEMANEDIQQELKIWSSSQRVEHYFVKEIEVGISTLPRDFPAQVVFVDTPGLSDPVAYRSELTKNYIRRANAVFVCVEAQKMMFEEMNTIQSVMSLSSHDKSKVFVIATHWDTLHDPETDWAKQKNFYIRRLTGPAFYDNQQMAADNILYSAAYIYNLCKNFHALDPNNRADKRQIRTLEDFGDYFDCAPDDLRTIGEKTNIVAIRKIIRDRLAANYKKFLAGDIKRKFMDVNFNLNRVASENKASMIERLTASYADEQELAAKLDEQRKKCDNVRQVSDQLNEIMKKVKHKTKTRADVICGKLRLKLSESKK